MRQQVQNPRLVVPDDAGGSYAGDWNGEADARSEHPAIRNRQTTGSLVAASGWEATRPKDFGKMTEDRLAAKSALCRAVSLLIQRYPDGVFLHSFSPDGVCLGDTWHRSVDEAKAQASYQFGCQETEWINVPPEVCGLAALVKFISGI